MNIILLGMPGSGKGTQADKLIKRYGLYFLPGGDLSRKWAKKDMRIKRIVEGGELIPEKEMTEHVLDYLNKNVPEGDNILFEGWPRFITQYNDLLDWLRVKGKDVSYVIFLRMDEESVIKRLSDRRVCVKCGEVYNLITNPPSGELCKCGGGLIIRKDDNPKSVRTRFQYYYDNTGKLVDHLRGENNFIEVNADRPIDVIFEDIVARLKENGRR